MTRIGLAESVGPDAGQPRQEFTGKFSVLYTAAGSPSLRSLAASAQRRAKAVRAPGSSVLVTAQRISDWKAGRNVPARFDTLHPVLLVLIDAVRRRGTAAGVELNVGMWRQLWVQAQATRARPSRDGQDERLPGAAAFSSQNALSFTGRDTAIRSLLQMVDDATARGREGRVIALTGASGVGKTSLLAAGVAPALHEREMQQISVWPMVMASDSTHALASIWSELRKRHEDGRNLIAANRAACCITGIVVVDQFERIFTNAVSSSIRAQLVTLLWELTEVAVVLICLRSSYILDCANYPFLADAVETRRYQLEPVTTVELRAIIRSGMRGRSKGEASGLEEALIASICGIRGDTERFGREPAELPILSHTLRSIASNRKGTRSDVDNYRRVGGAEGVVHTMADDLWTSISHRQRGEVKRILLRLIDVHSDIGYVRRRIPLQDTYQLFGGETTSLGVLDALISARLITMERYEVYLSHDLLLTWHRLRTWLDMEHPVRRADQERHRTDLHRSRGRWQGVAPNPKEFR